MQIREEKSFNIFFLSKSQKRRGRKRVVERGGRKSAEGSIQEERDEVGPGTFSPSSSTCGRVAGESMASARVM